MQPKPTSLIEKIGALLIVGFDETEISANSAIINDIQQYHLGGVILFNRNIKNPKQLQQLTHDLQHYSPHPLLIAIDQEGGQVARLTPKQRFPETYCAAELGANNDTNNTQQAAINIATTLSSMGINLNFAPCVDVNVNPNNPIIGKRARSFSSDPKTVCQHAQAFIEAHQQQNIRCAIKHFPGHGSSVNDSHLGFVDVSDTWNQQELLPFNYFIQHPFNGMIMTAHIFNKHLDKDYPATLSHHTITNMLRQQLGYQGVVVSDDLQMGAITQHYTTQQTLQLAINAGVDCLLFGNMLKQYNQNLTKILVENILQLVKRGDVSETQIDQAYQRIMTLKE